MAALVLHVLFGLQRAGLERAVVAVGEHAESIEAAVRGSRLTLRVDYVAVPPSVWRNLANSILMCKASFKGSEEPFLIVRADQLYDWRLLHKMACAPFAPGRDAFALVDMAPATLEWASGALCGPSCRHGGNTGRCNALVKVARGADGRAVRCGHRLGSFDAVVAGDVYVSRPKVFEVLARLLKQNSARRSLPAVPAAVPLSPRQPGAHPPSSRSRKPCAVFCTTSEAMAEFAMAGGLGCVEVGELSCHWFGRQTVAALYRASAASAPSAAPSAALVCLPCPAPAAAAGAPTPAAAPGAAPGAAPSAEGARQRRPSSAAPAPAAAPAAAPEAATPWRQRRPSKGTLSRAAWRHVLEAARELLESETAVRPPHTLPSLALAPRPSPALPRPLTRPVPSRRRRRC
jgi:hypothetical protein